MRRINTTTRWTRMAMYRIKLVQEKVLLLERAAGVGGNEEYLKALKDNGLLDEDSSGSDSDPMD